MTSVLGRLFSLLAVGSCSWDSLSLVPLLGSLYSLPGFCLVALRPVKVFFCNKDVVFATMALFLVGSGGKGSSRMHCVRACLRDWSLILVEVVYGPYFSV